MMPVLACNRSYNKHSPQLHPGDAARKVLLSCMWGCHHAVAAYSYSKQGCPCEQTSAVIAYQAVADRAEWYALHIEHAAMQKYSSERFTRCMCWGRPNSLVDYAECAQCHLQADIYITDACPKQSLTAIKHPDETGACIQSGFLSQQRGVPAGIFSGSVSFSLHSVQLPLQPTHLHHKQLWNLPKMLLSMKLHIITAPSTVSRAQQ